MFDISTKTFFIFFVLKLLIITDRPVKSQIMMLERQLAVARVLNDGLDDDIHCEQNRIDHKMGLHINDKSILLFVHYTKSAILKQEMGLELLIKEFF